MLNESFSSMFIKIVKNSGPYIQLHIHIANIQEVFHVYLNKFENAVTHLFLVIFGND